MKYLMGIDNGGTFSKAAIFDENGNQIAVASKKTEVYIPRPGYMERNLKDLWNVNIEVIRQVIKKSGISSKDIVGLSFSGHGKGLYLVGKDNKPLGNGILSTDTRAQEIVDEWKNNGIEEKFYEKTFQEFLVCQPIVLLAFIKKYNKKLYDEIKYVFSVKDFIRFMLTNEAYAEYSDFSGGNLINLKTKDYDIELLKILGMEELMDKLPPLKKSSDICGYITKEVAQMTGLSENTPVAAGMFDVDACGIATGLVDEEHLCMIAGTWSINEYISKEVVRNHITTLNSIYAIPNYFLIEESSPTSAGNLEWFIRNVLDTDLKTSEQYDGGIYGLVNKLVASIKPEENQLYFLPYLNGSSENSKAKASFIGLGMEHTKAYMLRAIYEGIVFSHMMHLEKLLSNRTRPKVIQLSGGAANSSVWVQIFADVIQIPIQIVKGKELGAQGAAMAAGVASGIYKDFYDAINKCVHFSDIIKPRREYRDIYQKKYLKYKYIVKTMNTIWNKINID